MQKLSSKHLLLIDDLTREDVDLIFKTSFKLKKKPYKKVLKNKILGMIFEKPSTRTRVSFEVAMIQAGGEALFLSKNDLQLGRGEAVKDTAIVLSRYVDGIMIRAFSHSTVEELARYSSVPVINGLTDLAHPCQALADFFTILEKKNSFENLKIAFIGDGNNVANSLVILSSLIGTTIYVASPKGFSIKKDVMERAKKLMAESGGKVILTTSPEEAAKDADVLYTDVWVSMGQEKETKKRISKFKKYRIDSKILKLAKPDAIVMHCLPARRGEEITDEVMDGPNSVVFDQAENRLHVQKAILSLML